MIFFFLIMLVFYFLPTVVGVATKRINSETINYIKLGHVKENDSSIALLLNVVSVIFFFTPITYLAWIAAFYFIIRNKKTNLEDIPVSQTRSNATFSDETNNNHELVEYSEAKDGSGIDQMKQGPREELLVQNSIRAKGEIEYKCVPAPVRTFVDSKSSLESGVQTYSKIVDKEVVGGWKFLLIHPIPVTKNPGFIAKLFGAKEYSVFFNMLIFTREVQ